MMMKTQGKVQVQELREEKSTSASATPACKVEGEVCKVEGEARKVEGLRGQVSARATPRSALRLHLVGR